MAPGRRDDSGAASRHVDQRAKARWFSGILQAGGDISVNVFGWDRRTPAAWADALAAEIAKHWQREYRLRLLGHPLSVRWRPADPELVQPWDSLAALVGTWPGRPDDLEGRWAAAPGELAGEKRLVDVLRRIPTRRLIVLGEPGTGKTILLVRLVLDLLSGAERTAGAPVPFLTSLSSWDPVQQELDDLLEQRLIVDFKGLHRRVAGGVHGRRRRCTLARALLQEHLVLPVLDGLDELPEHLRGMAVNRINEALGAGGRGLVLASRSAELRAALRPPDGIEAEVAGAAGVELLPVPAVEVVEHLRNGAMGPAARARWEEVSARIRTGPTVVPAAAALTTPLMARMADVIYNPRHGELLSSVRRTPAELLDRRFATPDHVRNHLLDAFVPAAYRYLAPEDLRRRLRWLRFLARDLQVRRNVTELDWWRLGDAGPALLPGLLVGGLAAVLGIYGLRIPASAGIGLMAAVGGGLLGRRLFGAGSSMARALGGGLIGGVAGTVVAMLTFGAVQGTGPSLTGALAACITVGSMGGFRAGLLGAFAGGFAAVLTGRPEVTVFAPFVNGLGLGLGAGCAVVLARHAEPARGYHWSLTGLLTGLAAGLTMGLAAGLQAGPGRGLLLAVVTAVLGSVAGGLEAAPADTAALTGPALSLAGDRRTFWATGLAGGLAVGVSTGLGPRFPPGPGSDFSFGLRVGIANAVAVGLAFGFLRAAYGRYTVARAWLALRGDRLPRRLMRFLDEAHQRGVLRQNGARYEFAHQDVQERLARHPADCSEGHKRSRG
ncbi:NACHT domain-containing protein [Streptomyces chrestomyceticus]|uniref:NACHT domain-containing protein n=1 Tax=Streptomyces chrestomyceticus TaxID=68185 RepID=UPI0033D20834